MGRGWAEGGPIGWDARWQWGQLSVACPDGRYFANSVFDLECVWLVGRKFRWFGFSGASDTRDGG